MKLPETTRQQIEAADAETLLEWIDRAEQPNSIQDVLHEASATGHRSSRWPQEEEPPPGAVPTAPTLNQLTMQLWLLAIPCESSLRTTRVVTCKSWTAWERDPALPLKLKA